MKKIALLSLLFVLTINVFAQKSKNTPPLTGTSFYAEVGGPGILFSANIDKRFTKNTTTGFGGRLGLGFVGYDDKVYDTSWGGYYYYGKRKSVITIPFQVNYIFAKPDSKSAFEVGAGVTFVGKKIDIFDSYRNDNASSIYGTASFMYRRMPKDGGFSWRLGFTPIFTKGYIQASGGVSIGYNF